MSDITTDTEFSEGPIESVIGRQTRGRFWLICGGLSFPVENPAHLPLPKKGDTARIYGGPQIAEGDWIRGLTVGDVTYFYEPYDEERHAYVSKDDRRKKGCTNCGDSLKAYCPCCHECGADLIAPYCHECKPRASAEAEALRKGIERALEGIPTNPERCHVGEAEELLEYLGKIGTDLRELLDRVDAGESVAWLEAREEERNPTGHRRRKKSRLKPHGSSA